MQEQLTKIAISIARIEINLKEHMRRTAMLEDRVKPLEEVVLAVKGSLKLLSILAMIATIAKVVSLWLH